MNKRCPHCGKTKTLDQFNRNRAKPDGLQNRCRDCQLEANRQWGKRHRSVRRAALKRQYEKEVLQGRRGSKTLAREKQNAHNAVYRAVKRGEICRPKSCSKCGATGFPIHAHHNDYTKPLEIEWVCSPCHGEIHAGLAA